MPPVRSRLQVSLGTVPPPPPGLRPFDDADTAALAALMWDAYRDTPDEEDVGDLQGATREMRLTLNGEYGTFLRGASFVAEHEGRPVAGALVTLYKDVPLLAFVFVAQSHTGHGLGRGLIQAVMHALADQGHDTLTLAVTRRNHRARRLYDQLGFVEVA
ncbi:GNAT family N-acetyltransferase [Spirillospora sp. NBC_00431]